VSLCVCVWGCVCVQEIPSAPVSIVRVTLIVLDSADRGQTEGRQRADRGQTEDRQRADRGKTEGRQRADRGQTEGRQGADRGQTETSH
jgi:hypothetical protein